MQRSKDGRFSSTLSQKDIDWIDLMLVQTDEPLTKTAEKVVAKTGLSYFHCYRVVMARYRQIKTRDLTGR